MFICCFSAFGVARGRESDAESVELSETGPSVECQELPTTSEHLVADFF